MIKNFRTVFCLALVCLLPLHSYANSDLTTKRAPVLEFLHKAFLAQVSLSEKERSKVEIEEILTPYFTKQYMELFLEQNLVEYEGQFITLGSDFALYYIPFFQFSDKTKIIDYQQKTYVYEYFPASDEGPVSYASHYEGLLLEQVDGSLRVSEYLYDNIPEAVIELGNQTMDNPPKKREQLVYIDKFLSFVTEKHSLDVFSRLLAFIGSKETDTNFTIPVKEKLLIF